MEKVRLHLLTLGILAVPALTVAPTAPASPMSLWDNCTKVHTRYPHGVGRTGAHDRTRSGSNPVTNFKRSTPLYNAAMRYNRDLDRDRDGIACEEH